MLLQQVFIGILYHQDRCTSLIRTNADRNLINTVRSVAAGQVEVCIFIDPLLEFGIRQKAD